MLVDSPYEGIINPELFKLSSPGPNYQILLLSTWAERIMLLWPGFTSGLDHIDNRPGEK